MSKDIWTSGLFSCCFTCEINWLKQTLLNNYFVFFFLFFHKLLVFVALKTQMKTKLKQPLFFLKKVDSIKDGAVI